MVGYNCILENIMNKYKYFYSIFYILCTKKIVKLSFLFTTSTSMANKPWPWITCTFQFLSNGFQFSEYSFQFATVLKFHLSNIVSYVHTTLKVVQRDVAILWVIWMNLETLDGEYIIKQWKWNKLIEFWKWRMEN